MPFFFKAQRVGDGIGDVAKVAPGHRRPWKPLAQQGFPPGAGILKRSGLFLVRRGERLGRGGVGRFHLEPLALLADVPAEQSFALAGLGALEQGLHPLRPGSVGIQFEVPRRRARGFRQDPPSVVPAITVEAVGLGQKGIGPGRTQEHPPAEQADARK